MRKVFLDTNIIVDLIADRKPFSKYAIEIFNAAETKKIQLFASSHSIATIFYILKKFHEEKTLKAILLSLFDYLTIVPVDASILMQGLRSRHKDMEDAMQIYCAMTVNQISYIVTRNIKDFKSSEVKVLTPDEFCVAFL